MALAWQILLAALIGLVIGALLGMLIWRAWRRRMAQQSRRTQQRGVLDSLEVLCMAVDQKQVEISEAAIRISALLDTLPESIAPKVDLSDIHQFAETCQQFDRGALRRGLTARARHQQDKYREELEGAHRQRIERAAQRLFAVLPAWRHGLGLSSSER